MLKILQKCWYFELQCAAMSAASKMGHDVMFTLFGAYNFGSFFHNNF
jgi:hypothetical protein